MVTIGFIKSAQKAGKEVKKHKKIETRWVLVHISVT